MATINLEAHDMDARFRHAVAAAGCMIVDEANAPWDVEFQGPRAALEKLITDEWGIEPEDLQATLDRIEGE